MLGLGQRLLGQEGHASAACAKRLDGRVRRAPRPGDGQVPVGEAQHAHEVHGPDGQVGHDGLDPQLGEQHADLGDGRVVGAQAPADQHRLRVEPGGVRALEDGVGTASIWASLAS